MDQRAWLAFLFLCLLSLSSDVVYEGARSVSGAFLNLLETPAIALGILGVGEFVSYGMRFLSGLLVDRMASSGLQWRLIYAGYAVNLAIPLLALVGRWEMALGLLLLERIGKGLRHAPRDVILAELTKGFGRGKGFGIHELMDQIGAILGPLIFALALHRRGVPSGYPLGFSILWIPAILSLLFLAFARIHYRRTSPPQGMPREGAPLGWGFWSFSIGGFLTGAGLLHWGIVSFHSAQAERLGLLLAKDIALLYLVAMVVDAIIAPLAGLIYDTVGLKAVMMGPIFSVAVSPLVFGLGGAQGLYLGACFWGAAVGIIESVMRAGVSELVPAQRLALAYGIFSLGLGLGFMVGSVTASILYSLGCPLAISAFCAGCELLALLAFYRSLKRQP